MSNLTEIRPVAAAWTEGWTDRQTNIRKVKGVFGVYAKTPGNDLKLRE